MVFSYDNDLEKITCRLMCGDQEEVDRATAFLIAPNKAITARHAIKDYFDENKEITLEFLNVTQQSRIIRANPIGDIACAISILELEEVVECNGYPKFYNYEVRKDDFYETYGYPTVKWDVGQRIKSNVSRRISDTMTMPFDWDIDLNHDSPISDFKGLSGSPLIVNGMLVGVILTEATDGRRALSLGSISVQRIREVLNSCGIVVEEPPLDYILDEIYEVDEVDYSDSIFISMLESAQIYDHEDCQQDFFNAEIAKSSIESRNIASEVKDFRMLVHDVKGIWKTQHRGYSDEEDGNLLLANVYQRVEDLSSTTLQNSCNLPLMVKKGILHQLSDERKLGWVKRFEKRLEAYLVTKGRIDND